jgi:uncharacterized membrane protein YkvA (DUF1232 family)
VRAALRRRLRALRRDSLAQRIAARDPRVPWYAKALALAVAAYALSPIDLIPDFLPVIGHLDDLILVPAGLALALRLVPSSVRRACLAEATRRLPAGEPRGDTAHRRRPSTSAMP